MDTSLEYIKMCDWPEIQEQRHTFVMADPTSVVKGKWVAGVDGGETYKPRDRVIQLFKQDQLQEMVLSDFVQQEGGYLPTYWLLHKFEHWLPDYRYANTSMEQLWLAFYMSEKFSKKWDGDKWIALIATQTLKG